MNGNATATGHANGHTTAQQSLDYDVVIVGAGISGINAGTYIPHILSLTSNPSRQASDPPADRLCMVLTRNPATRSLSHPNTPPILLIHDPRRPPRTRRHMVALQIPRHPLRLRPTHLRIPLPSMAEAESDCFRREHRRVSARDSQHVWHRQEV